MTMKPYFLFTQEGGNGNAFVSNILLLGNSGNVKKEVYEEQDILVDEVT